MNVMDFVLDDDLCRGEEILMILPFGLCLRLCYCVEEIVTQMDFVLEVVLCRGGEILMVPPSYLYLGLCHFVREIANLMNFVLDIDLCLGGEILMLLPFDLSLTLHDFLSPMDFYLYRSLCYFVEEENGNANEMHFVLDVYLCLCDFLNRNAIDLYLGLCYCVEEEIVTSNGTSNDLVGDMLSDSYLFACLRSYHRSILYACRCCYQRHVEDEHCHEDHAVQEIDDENYVE